MSSIKKYIKSDANVICDVCGRKRKWHEVTMAFGSGDIPVIASCIDGCADDRHPLNDPPPVIIDGQAIPNARPDVPASNPLLYITTVTPSFMSWGFFIGAGQWGDLNNPNTDFNLNGQWTWGYFIKV